MFLGSGGILSHVPGVTDAVSGYASGRGKQPSTELINQTGHAETGSMSPMMLIKFLVILLHYSALSIQPKINREWCGDPSTKIAGLLHRWYDLEVINQVFDEVAKNKDQPLAVEKEKSWRIL